MRGLGCDWEKARDQRGRWLVFYELLKIFLSDTDTSNRFGRLGRLAEALAMSFLAIVEFSLC
jgi:hypothetical protein